MIWKGTGINEIGYDEKTDRELVKIDPKYFRPTEVETLLDDASKERLGCNPQHSFDKLVKEKLNFYIIKLNILYCIYIYYEYNLLSYIIRSILLFIKS